jgi:transcriptional/translational regulatory protein YebC/TACO1
MALEQAGIELESAELLYRPSALVEIEHEGQVIKLMKLIDALEDNDDVGAVHANFDAPAEMLERAAG